MEDSKKKELIEVIKERLKNADPIPYRQGAWEAYRAKYEPRKVRRIPIAYWASAAALAVAAFAAFFILKDNVSEELLPKQGGARIVQEDHHPAPAVPGEQRIAQTESTASRKISMQGHARVQPNAADAVATGHATSLPPMAASAFSAQASWQPVAASLKPDAARTFAVTRPLFADADDIREVSNLGGEFTLAQRVGREELRGQEAGLHLSPKKFNVSQKFEFGAFLSPSTTNQSFDVGGGLMLAYQLSDKIAVRTGASFNQYEVSVLGSNLSQNGGGDMYNSPVEAANGAALVSKDVPYRASNLLLPNLNSVSGKVQTLDVPLEIKYNVGKQFYATGGVSYAVVLSQERFNHITEYTGVPTYSSASDSDQPTNQPSASAVERTLQSGDNNVNTNGFGGFVNFSIGRKTKLTKSVKLSIEPYLKMPIGQFKRADMDYTNGGLRVITNF